VDQARPYVLAVQDGRAVQRAVVLGLRGEATIDGRVENAVELTAGAAAGDTLLRDTAGALRDGTPVTLAAPAPAASATSAARGG
jgi:hypothetical protein